MRNVRNAIWITLGFVCVKKLLKYVMRYMTFIAYIEHKGYDFPTKEEWKQASDFATECLVKYLTFPKL